MDVDELERLGQAAIPLLEQAANHSGLVRVWSMRGYTVANMRGRNEDWIRASERALEHSRAAGQRITHLFRLENALAYGSGPAHEALRTLEALLSENGHPHSRRDQARVLAMLGL